VAIFFFQAQDGIRIATVTGVQTCALPISGRLMTRLHRVLLEYVRGQLLTSLFIGVVSAAGLRLLGLRMALLVAAVALVVEVIPRSEERRVGKDWREGSGADDTGGKGVEYM